MHYIIRQAIKKVIDGFVVVLGERVDLVQVELSKSFNERYSSRSDDLLIDYVRVYPPSGLKGAVKKFYKQIGILGLNDMFLKSPVVNIITDDKHMLNMLLKRAHMREDFNVIKDSELPNVVNSLKRFPVILVFYKDEELIKSVGVLKRNKIFYIPIASMKLTARYFHKNNTALHVLNEAQKLPLTKFDLRDFENVLQAIEVTKNVPGDIVEIGVYKGRSAQVICDYCKCTESNKRIYLIDTFQGIAFDTARKSVDISWYQTHQQDLDARPIIDQVKELLKNYDYKLVKSDITREPLPASIQKISFCNVDVDLEESTYSALTKVAPLIQVGGIIICEDAGHTPPLAGAAYAVDRFLKSDAGSYFTPIYMWSGQYVMVRVSR